MGPAGAGRARVLRQEAAYCLFSREIRDVYEFCRIWSGDSIPAVAVGKALLDKLTQQHGFDPERRRHLALAFTLLAPERQPVRGIKDLLVGVPVYGKRGGGVGALLPPAFSPGLADYLYADPLALLPRTQLPVLDSTKRPLRSAV